jgi:hypothetical protein
MGQGKPGKGTKRQQMLRTARETKRQRREALEVQRSEELEVEVEVDLPDDLLARVGIEEDSELEESEYSEDSDFEEESDCELTDTEDPKEEPVKINKSAFDTLMGSSRQIGYDAFEDNTAIFNYQRGAEPSIRTQQRRVKNARELEEGAKNTRTLETYFSRPGGKQANPVVLGRPTACISSQELRRIERDEAIKSIQKKIHNKKEALAMNAQNLMRHEAVLAFLHIQKSKKLGETREYLALQVARCFGKGIYFARRIVTWEGDWLRDREIPEGKRGCFSKTKSWFKDEGVEQAVREWLSGRSGDGKFSGAFSARSRGQHLGAVARPTSRRSLADYISRNHRLFFSKSHRRISRLQACGRSGGRSFEVWPQWE